LVSSGRHAIVSLLLLFSAVISAQSQSAVDKSATSTISGKVTAGGKGVAGVVVGLRLEESLWRSQPTGFKAVTNEEGNYRITKVRPGTYEVIAAAPAFVAADGRKSVIVGKNEVVENIDITLLRGGVITGRVTDADGFPVIEEEVTLYPVKAVRLPRYVQMVRTDDRGIYRAFGVPAGSYKLASGRDPFGTSWAKTAHRRTYHPSALDEAQATVIEVSEGSEATDIDIRLGRSVNTYSARGLIIDGETSRPLPNTKVGVQMFIANGSASISPAAESTKDGEFKVENLSPGKYSVYLERSGERDWYGEAVRFEVIDQDVEGLLIRTAKGASVSGVVIIEGSDDPTVRGNLANGRVHAQVGNESPASSNASGQINPDGSFRLTGLPAGRLLLHVDMLDHLRLIRLERDGVVYPRGVEIKEREQFTGLRVVLGHANGKIRGVIKIPEGLVLPATARLLVSLRRTEDATPGSYGSPVEADARGQFLIERLVAGTYEINVDVFVNTPPPQRLRIPRTRQTVVVTYGNTAEVTITLQMPRSSPGGP
jgi:hypothetical protein